AIAHVRIGAASIRLEREVTFRILDEAVGEIRHPLRAVPKLEVFADPALVVWPQSRFQPLPIQVTLTSNSADPLSGTVEVFAAPGWPKPRSVPFSLARKGDRALV